jgi:hypothetical protein
MGNSAGHCDSLVGEQHNDRGWAGLSKNLKLVHRKLAEKGMERDHSSLQDTSKI